MRFIHVTLTVKPEKATLYEQTFNELQKLVVEHEPGCRLFEVCRDPTQPFTYHVLEAYADQSAVAAHTATDYYMRTAEIFVECLAGDHMEEIRQRKLTGLAMYSVVKNLQFQRLETL
jgi:autoinducer 2-degrading protein